MVRNKKIITVILAGFVLLSLIQPVMTRADEPREPDRKAEITILVNEPPVDNETNDINMMGAAGKKVVVDPGHGKEGSPGDKGYLEYKAMWELANHLKDALERCGVEVHLTKQSAEENPSLEDRGKLAKDKDLFISLHSNAFSGESVDGCEVYYSVEQSGNKKYAEKLSKKGSEIMGNSDRGAETKESEENPGKDYYGVIRSAVKAGCPYVFLVESGFHTNDEDRDFLQNDANLKKLAEGYAEVICDILDVDYIDEKTGAVIAMINALPEVNKLTLKNEGAVKEARAAYDALTDEQKDLVTNLDKLTEAEAKIKELESAVKDVKDVKDKIDALPEVEDLTLEHKAQVEEARAAYDALTEEQKDLVANLDKLTNAEAKIKELESAVKDVKDKIDALPEVDELTLEHKAQVEGARAAYDALTEEQKDLVTNLDKLTKAEAKIEELKTEVDAEAVKDMIEALPSVEDLTLENKTKVEEARVVYDALTEEQKELVTNLDKLTAAEKKIEELEIEAVKDKIANLPSVEDLALKNEDAVEEAREAYNALTEEQQESVENIAKLTEAEAKIAELKSEIEAVEAMIDDFPSVEELKLENKTEVEEARAAYDALTEEQKALVTNIDQLTKAEAKIEELELEIEDVKDKIDALPEVEDMTLEDEDAVEEARAAYDALTEEQKDLVTNLDKLTEAEVKIEELEVEAVKAMIESLPEDPTLEDREAIEKAWVAYDALTEEQQESVENIDKLIKVEEKIRVEIVKAMIESLPSDEDMTLEDEGAVEEAREAYDALTEEQKALVSEEHVDKLEAAEERIGELIKVETVKDMIDVLPEADELTLEDEYAVKEARAAYDALTEGQKALVTNLDKLTAAEVKIEELKSEEPIKEEPIENEMEEVEKEIEVEVITADQEEIEVDVITEDQDGLTKTGDSSSIRMYIAIALIAATLILLLIKPKKKHS